VVVLRDRINIEQATLKIIEKICSSKLNDNIKKSFRARTRDLISDLYSSGVAYVISLCAARSSADAVELGLTALNPENFIGIFEDENMAKKYGLNEDEDYGYAIYGSSILYLLKLMGIINFRKLSDAIMGLSEDILANRMAFETGVWLKRFAEAYL